MIFLPFLHFFSFTASIFLAVYIYKKDPKSLLNRMCSIVMLCYALWNFGDIIVHNPDRAITEDLVKIMQNIASIGWVSFASANLCFALVFAKREELIRKKWFLFIVFALPLLFLYKQLTNHLTINPSKQVYGWSVEWTNSIWTYLFYTYCLTFSFLSILISYFYGRKTKNIIEKKQAKIIVSTYCIGILAGTLLEIVMLQLGIYSIPPMGNLLVFVFATGVMYAVMKYRFLTITPTIAAENIISVMDEFLILLNNEAKILTVNKATTDSLQFGQNELEGKPFTILFQDERFKTYLFEKITKEEVISNQDSCLLSKNGRSVPIIYSSSPLKDKSGVLIGTVFIARDITLHKQIESELIKSKEKAEESDHLKTVFLANMSHEIRTPMNAISGFSELIEFENDEDKRRQYLKIIQNSSSNLMNLVLDIIELSRIEVGDLNLKYSDCNVHEMFVELNNVFSNELIKREKSDVQLSYILEDKYLTTHSDKNRLRQVMSNLLDNALKFTSKGTIKFTCEKKDDNLIFSVTDTGTGIPAEDQNKIFDYFTKFNYQELNNYGTGIGLSIVEKIVEKLKGRIWFKSVWGEGSSFFFSIPYIKPITDPETEFGQKVHDDSASVAAESRSKILVVEDDKTSFILIKELLKSLNVEIHHVIDGIDAIDFVKINPDTQLILMDVKLPGMNGYDATQAIKQINPGIPVIVQTAHAMLGEREKALSFGCDDYITKPLNLKKLQELVKQYLSN